MRKRRNETGDVLLQRGSDHSGHLGLSLTGDLWETNEQDLRTSYSGPGKQESLSLIG